MYIYMCMHVFEIMLVSLCVCVYVPLCVEYFISLVDFLYDVNMNVDTYLKDLVSLQKILIIVLLVIIVCMYFAFILSSVTFYSASH